MIDATSFFRTNADSALPRLFRGVTKELSWILLVLSLGLTVFAYCLTHYHAQRSTTDALRAQAMHSTATIKARLDVSAQLLRSTAAMLMLDRTVQRQTWEQYVQNLAHQGWPDALQQLGYAQRISASEKTALSTAMQADAMPDYQIYPLRDQSLHAPILFIAPETGRPTNARPGFDLLSSPATKQALTRATDSGAIAFHPLETAQRLAPDGPHTDTVVALLVLPLFPGNAVPSTQALRQQLVIGFVFAIVKTDELLRNISAPHYRPVRLTELPDHGAVTVPNGVTISGADVLTVPLDLFGSRWQINAVATGTPAAHTFDGNADTVAISGVIISVLLFAIIRSLAATRSAHQSRSRLSLREIRHLKNQLSALIACNDDAIIIIDRRQRILMFNASAEAIFGVRAATAIGMGLSRFLPHRLKGAKRADSNAVATCGNKLSMYRLHNTSDEFACRFRGERFPFEATIFKCAQWGHAGYMILLKDLTNDTQPRSAGTQTSFGLARAGLPGAPNALPLPADTDTPQAVHFEIAVGESVCDATFDLLAGGRPLATRSLLQNLPQLACEDLEAHPTDHRISVNEFIDTRIHADDRAAVKQQWKRAFRSGEEVDCVYRMLLANDEIQLIRHWMASATGDGSGRRFVGVLYELQQEPESPQELQHELHQESERKSHQSLYSASQQTSVSPLRTDALMVDAVIPTAERNERRRWQPDTVETGRLYRQLQCRIMTFESVREAQQKQLAREMHDDFGQLLTAMKMDLVVLQAQLAKVDHRLSQQLGDVSDLVDAMVVSVRRIIANLPPQHIDQHGLLKALELLAGAHAKRHRITCRLHAGPQLRSLDNVMITPIYRIVQEALNNVAKHARATEIDICIEQRDDKLHLSVTDNGNGMTVPKLQTTGGFGLIGMRERVSTLNGEMAIDTASGIGTTIRIVIPVDVVLAS